MVLLMAIPSKIDVGMPERGRERELDKIEAT